MITMSYSSGMLKVREHEFGIELQKQRRDRSGKFLPPERTVIIDRDKVSEYGLNHHLIKLYTQMGLL